jgi:hypothetical protein
VYLVLLLGAGAILGGVVVVAMGDVPVGLTRPRSPADIATQRLPLGPIGYQVQATEEALIAAANLLAERDQEIAELRSEIWRLGCADQAAVHDRPVDSDEAAQDAGDAATQAGLAGSEQSWLQ